MTTPSDRNIAPMGVNMTCNAASVLSSMARYLENPGSGVRSSPGLACSLPGGQFLRPITALYLV
jgi:hypothetical protein